MNADERSSLDRDAWLRTTGSQMSKGRRSKRAPGRLVSPGFTATLLMLGGETRRRILVQLARAPTDRQTLAKELGLPTSTITRHLDWLREHELLRVERSGRRNVYRLGRHARAIADHQKAILQRLDP